MFDTVNDVCTFLIGGEAGEGVKNAGLVAARLFSGRGFQVFEMDDYQSLIRGGHNFSVISAARRQITSHYMRADLIVTLDKRSYDLHLDHLAKGGILVYNADKVSDAEGVGLPLTTEAKKYPNPKLRVGVGAIATLAAFIGMDRDLLESFIEHEYRKDVENNIAYALSIYDLAYPEIGGKFSLGHGDPERPILSGNEAIALGAACGGLDTYFAYPMTPATSILHYLAAHDRDLGLAVVHPENEIAAINMAIGATFAGARAMIGTSGGGFALMEEAFSLAGMVESPLFCILSSRSGPSTGVPTYTEQADLRFAINQGHGDFPRIVASPGSIQDAFYLASEMLSMVWRFQTPGILLTEKHLSESRMTVDIDEERVRWPEVSMHTRGEYKRYLDTADGISPLMFPPSKELIKWNSYCHDEIGITTDDPELTVKAQDKRKRKQDAILDYMKEIHTVNIYGDGSPAIFTYGSTTMSVLEALRAGGMDLTVVQPIYLEPLPVWELERYVGRDVLVVEESSSGQFATLLEERAGIVPQAVIKRYDGRPFDPIELANEIRELV